MRTFIFAVLIIASAACHSGERTIWVFGDSLSGTPEAWPFLLQEQGYATVRNLAIPSMRMSQLNLPSFLTCGRSKNPQVGRFDEVVIWMGTNDARGGKLSAYKTRMRATLDTLQEKRCEVTLILVPSYRHDPAMNKLVRPYRKFQVALAKQYPNVRWMEMVWDADMMIDRLHQSPELHQLQAAYFAKKKGLKK